ncbi:MAG: lytic transglycosylase domain-containing protein, partial [Alphaproteobacteria bacterium]|nr:lytic transglycosylase domain-containing protein [Alphaproteobacteria bacterium]
MFRSPPAKAVYAFGIALFFATSSEASPQSDALVRAYEAQWSGDWDLAKSEAQGVGVDIIEWNRLRAGRGSFAEYQSFLKRNPDWPGLPLLAQKGEATIPVDADPNAVLEYLSAYPAQTGVGAVRMISAYEARGMNADAQAQTVLVWNTLPMDAKSEEGLAARYASILAPHHVARTEMLLWAERFDDAARMIPRLPTGWDKLIAATRKLMRDEAGVDAALAEVTGALADHPVLAHARFEWRVRRGRNEDAMTLLLQRSTGREGLGNPEDWGNRRRT